MVKINYFCMKINEFAYIFHGNPLISMTFAISQPPLGRGSTNHTPQSSVRTCLARPLGPNWRSKHREDRDIFDKGLCAKRVGVLGLECTVGHVESVAPWAEKTKGKHIRAIDLPDLKTARPVCTVRMGRCCEKNPQCYAGLAHRLDLETSPRVLQSCV